MRWSAHTALTLLSTRHLRSLIRQCTRRSALDIGKKLHATIITGGVAASADSFLYNALLHLYAACASPIHAHKVFDEIPNSHKDTVDWTIMMGSLGRHSMHRNGLALFVEMRREGVKVDDVALVCFMGGCARLGNIEVGLQGHGFMVKVGLSSSVKACNAAMDMYVKCGELSMATRVFDHMGERSVVSWTVILDGVIRWEGVGSGRVVFDAMLERNEVAWTVMIVGYVSVGFVREGFALLQEMVFGCGFGLNYVTLCSFLSACAQSGDVVTGSWVHAYASKTMGSEMDVMVGTALVDMYAKCGRVDAALKVFEHLKYRNVVTWNALLSGLAMHGRGRAVMKMFPQMLIETKPDDLTFTALLSACSHSGLVEQGRYYFQSLEPYGVTPKIEHYASMVDLLGRAGHLEEAETLIRRMPMPPNEVVLGSLIGSCSVHGKLHLGERILQDLLQIDPHNTEYHVLLSNMYALCGKQDSANLLRQGLKKRGIRKMPGMSSIYVSGQVHQFSAGDKSHPLTAEIYSKLDEMIQKLRVAGYVPNTACQVFSGFDNRYESDAEKLEEMEQALFCHCEKLAVCFGLISTRAGSPLHIFKNLRICQDCHSAMKLVSLVYDREIVIRDRNRFHCFKQGSCSCSDYW